MRLLMKMAISHLRTLSNSQKSFLENTLLTMGKHLMNIWRDVRIQNSMFLNQSRKQQIPTICLFNWQ